MPPFIANHLCCFQTLRSGVAISNPRFKEPGTLGFIGTSDGNDRWLVSCYHVLCRRLGESMPTASREPITYHFDNRDPKFVLAFQTADNADRALDCAAAKIETMPSVGRILGIGRYQSSPIDAKVGMRVIKSGIATGVSEGIVRRAPNGGSPVIRIESLDMTTNYMLCDHGDSGALWLDAETLRPVGLHTGGESGDETRVAVGVPISLVLKALKLTIIPPE